MGVDDTSDADADADDRADTDADADADTPSLAPTMAPTTTATVVTQTVTISEDVIANVDAYTGDVKDVFETGYAIAIGIYDDTSNEYEAGCSVDSTASAARRAGVAIEFTATI